MMRLFAFLLAACLYGCGTHPGYPGGDVVGHLGVSGSAVQLNSTAATTGAAVHSGATVQTGAASSAIVEFYFGGDVQLDQHAAATLVKERQQPGLCTVLTLQQGTAWLRADRGCAVRVETMHGAALISGEAQIETNSSATRWYAHRGKLTLASGTTLSRGQSAQSPEQSTVPQAASSTWRDSYRFAGWCCFGRTPLPGHRDRCARDNFSFDEASLTMECKLRDGGFRIFHMPPRAR